MFAASKSGRAGGATTDPNFKNVSLLLETTSTNGQQNNTFLDSSSNGFTITRSGTPTQGSVTPYWPDGYWSNYFDTATTSYLTASSTSSFNLTGNFTVEAWVNPSTILTGANGIFDARVGGQTPAAWLVSIDGNGKINFYTGTSYVGATTVSTNVWSHIAVVRSGGTLTFYLNGSVDYTNASFGTGAISPGATSAVVGTKDIAVSASYRAVSTISNLRIVVGTAVYTATFTPPTTPLTAITNTILLTCQSNRFKDNSSSPLTLAPTGTPKNQPFQPFSPAASYTTALYGGSIYSGTKTDAITATSVASLNTLAGDFTLEAWVYPTDTSITNWGMMDTRASGGSASAWVWSLNSYISSPAGWVNAFYTGTQYTFGTRIPSNTWSHVVLQRNGSTVRSFVNGVVDAITATVSGTITGGATTVAINNTKDSGLAGYGNIGYTSNFRFVNGTAVYATTGFTPPTAPVTAITNTSLLLNYTNAGIYDAAVQNNELTVGSAQASTTVAKWSPTSMKFNGTTDYLTSVRSDGYNLGTAYTVEAWVYPSSVSGNQGIINLSTGATVNAGFNFYLVGSTVTVNNGSLGGTGPSGGTLATGQWYYIAIVCNGTNTVLYINGTLTNTYVGVTGFSGTWTNATIGNIADKSMYFNGYIQDLRLTRGVARTVTTVPTAAFPTR
jgi:hypothetical protein